MEINIKNAFETLKKYLQNSDKFEHSIRVAKTSKFLAQKWNAPVEDAIIASLLHDIGKSLSRREMLSLCVRNGITVYDFELFETPKSLHGKISSLIFENEFDNDDIERFNSISHAISTHVTGDDEMSILDKVVFIADNVEPNRKNDFLSRIQSGELNSPDECIKLIINNKLEKAKKKDWEPNPLLKRTLDSLEER